MKKYLLSLSLMAFSLIIFAQSGTNSPYSMYGLGVISDQSNGAGRGMNGVGLAFREGNQINYLNPASYSSVDSLTFIFDIGMSLQNTNFKAGNSKVNAKNANFEYAIAGFRALRHFGMAFGILPYTNIGYDFSSKGDTIKDYTMYPNTEERTMLTNTYSGSGGLHQIFIGGGWEITKGLSVGANVSYLWGTLDRGVTNTYSDSYIRASIKAYNQDVSSYKLDFGAQYYKNINKNDVLTVGVTYSPGHKLGSNAELLTISVNSGSAIADTTLSKAAGGYSIPTQFGLGFGYAHGKKWRAGLDYTLQKWGSIEAIPYKMNRAPNSIVGYTNSYTDRHKINFGGEYCKNVNSRRFSERIRWRAGASYTTPYLKINGKDGPKEISVSAGAGIPIINAYNNRSILNVGLQWTNQSGSFITENTIRLNIGLTFNERWFAKWKFE